MDPRDQINTLLKEADLYQQQGLLNEAKQRYKKATDIIKQHAGIPNSQALIASIVKKVVDLNQKISKINQATSKPTVSGHKQDLIKKLFAGGGEKDGVKKYLTEGGNSCKAHTFVKNAFNFV